jgi:ABC-type transport system substrate-binding protein
MNLAMPPFDDVHVRRALNYAVDRSGIVDVFATVPEDYDPTWPVSPFGGIDHVAPDWLEESLLDDYHPYPAAPGGDLAKAQEEMALSRYDGNGDGRCDDESCTGVTAVSGVFWDPGLDPLVTDGLAAIGLDLEVEHIPVAGDFYARIGDPEQHVAVAFTAGWGPDYPNATALFDPLFRSSTDFVSVYTFNPSLLGATDDQLAAWGYDVDQVDSLDEEIVDCERRIGAAQTECWARLDQIVMESIVPWVPLVEWTQVRILSPRIAGYSFCQFTLTPALDRIALVPGSD